MTELDFWSDFLNFIQMSVNDVEEYAETDNEKRIVKMVKSAESFQDIVDAYNMDKDECLENPNYSKTS